MVGSHSTFPDTSKWHMRSSQMDNCIIDTSPAIGNLSEYLFSVLRLLVKRYNAKGFGDFENGFTPDYEINENKPNGEYFEGYGDFGAESDPLYAKAISLISGNEVTTPTRAVNQAKDKC